MHLPSILNKGEMALQNKGDYFNARRTDSDRLVVTAKKGHEKLSAVFYPSTRTVVETKSYKI